jgi:hypothetical protein
MDEFQQVEPPKKRNPFRFIRKIRGILILIVASILIYTVVAPLIITLGFPQYGIFKKYDRVSVCTIQTTVTTVFLPVNCSKLSSNTIGCIYGTATTYTSPDNGSSDQKLLCKTLTSQPSPLGGPPLLALAGLNPDQATLQRTIGLIISGFMFASYLVFKITTHFTKKSVKPTIQPFQNKPIQPTSPHNEQRHF